MARRRSLRSLLAGSLLGGALVMLARRRRTPPTQGLAAFEGAPCHRAAGDGRLPVPAVAPAAGEPDGEPDGEPTR